MRQFGPGDTVSDAKTEIVCLKTKAGGSMSFTAKADGEVYKHTVGIFITGCYTMP